MATYKVNVTNIKYDIDHDQSIGPLPDSLTLDVENVKDIEDLYEKASDAISDKTGFCHFGFKLTILAQDD
jgi:hypothetical protein